MPTAPAGDRARACQRPRRWGAGRGLRSLHGPASPTACIGGLGQALYEEAVLDDDGIPAARSLLDYLIPTVAEVPPIRLEETHTPNPNVALGTKGAGEAGCIGVPPAVVNAVCDALDIDHIDMPLTPETVWRAAGSPP